VTSQTDLVDLVFERLFGAHPDAAELRNLLDTVGDPPSPRLQLAVLKMSEGDPQKLKQNIELARIDYRDVLAYAEYPQEKRT